MEGENEFLNNRRGKVRIIGSNSLEKCLFCFCRGLGYLICDYLEIYLKILRKL